MERSIGKYSYISKCSSKISYWSQIREPIRASSQTQGCWSRCPKCGRRYRCTSQIRSWDYRQGNDQAGISYREALSR